MFYSSCSFIMTQNIAPQPLSRQTPFPVSTGEQFARLMNVSRETLEAFELWHSCLKEWNERMNLVSTASLDVFWTRHALDSAQIWRFVPEIAQNLVDCGSGAGFPGLALALMAREEKRNVSFSLIESQGKKVSFLRHMVQRLELSVTVVHDRLEHQTHETYDVITARALAPLNKLLGYAHRVWGENSLGLFLKGQKTDQELQEARQNWGFEVRSAPSLSDPGGKLLQITNLISLSSEIRTRT